MGMIGTMLFFRKVLRRMVSKPDDHLHMSEASLVKGAVTNSQCVWLRFASGATTCKYYPVVAPRAFSLASTIGSRVWSASVACAALHRMLASATTATSTMSSLATY